ncbi:hypothetical protein JK364_46155 [Streptomyces sp. 110]|uniref:Uncharacterized protein n=1 Tax=Streptomyces endocoffeicus TaxID=2898945 RepID=A0ABS1Q4Q6_9ACTN|nr:hypothetical protein [Streptomyces endocoffeicus]MBL1119656.1 hypothetical protein [Streptomyces endocoffeicus]
MSPTLALLGVVLLGGTSAIWAALAADLLSPILADVTGMHRHTALRWVTYARRDWAEYLAARTGEHGQGVREQGWSGPGRIGWRPSPGSRHVK